MSDPIALVPLPKSVTWGDGVWSTRDPWEGLQVRISQDLGRTEYRLEITTAGADLRAGTPSTRSCWGPRERSPA
jgi:hexosaminidase